MTDKKQAVEKVIREHNPELQELSFGCEIQPFNNLRRFGTPRFVSYKDGVLIHEEEGEIGKSKCSTGDILPIGHPIHLEHVLRAVERERLNHKKYAIGISTVTCAVDGALLMLSSTDMSDNIEICYYNLSLPFSQQDDSVFEFLYEILFP